MHADLVTRLNAAAGITAITGSRISWFERPRRGGDADSIVLTDVVPGREYTHSGATALKYAWVQFDLWSANAATLITLEAAVIAEMERGPSVTTGGTIFHPAFLEGRQSFDPTDLEGGVRMYRIALDLRFYHEPTA